MKNEEQKLYQIGEYVRICRKKGGYSQEELAEGVDVSKMTISRIENGENAMSILPFFQIVSFLDISEEEVIRLFRNCDKACREAQGWR